MKDKQKYFVPVKAEAQPDGNRWMLSAHRPTQVMGLVVLFFSTPFESATMNVSKTVMCTRQVDQAVPGCLWLPKSPDILKTGWFPLRHPCPNKTNGASQKSSAPSARPFHQTGHPTQNTRPPQPSPAQPEHPSNSSNSWDISSTSWTR